MFELKVLEQSMSQFQVPLFQSVNYGHKNELDTVKKIVSKFPK